MGVTVHWISVKEDKWRLRAKVVGFQGVLGSHDGGNLGRYTMLLCERVGIVGGLEPKVRSSRSVDSLCLPCSKSSLAQ